MSLPTPQPYRDPAQASHKRKRVPAPILSRTYTTAGDSRSGSHSIHITTGRGHRLPAHPHHHGHSALAAIRAPGRLRASRSVPAYLRLAPDAPIKSSESTLDGAVTPDTPLTARNPHPDKRARSSDALPPLTFSDSSTDDDLDLTMQTDIDPTPTVERTMLEHRSEDIVAPPVKNQTLETFNYTDWLALKASYGYATRLYEGGQNVEAIHAFLSIITECSRCWLTVPNPSILFTSGPRRSSTISYFAASDPTPAPIRPSTPPSILLHEPTSRIRPPEMLKSSNSTAATHHFPPTPPTTPSIDLGKETASSLHTLFACSLSIYGTLLEFIPDPPSNDLDASTYWHAALNLFAAGDAALARSQPKEGDINPDWRVVLIQGRTFAQLALFRRLGTHGPPPNPLSHIIRTIYPQSNRQLALDPLLTPCLTPNLISNAVDHLLAALLLVPPTTSNRHLMTWIVASDILALTEIGTSSDQQGFSREIVDAERIWRAKRADGLFARVERALSPQSSSQTHEHPEVEGSDPRNPEHGHYRIKEPSLADVHTAQQRCRLLMQASPPAPVPEFSRRAPRRSSTTSVVRVALKEMMLQKQSPERDVRVDAGDIHML